MQRSLAVLNAWCGWSSLSRGWKAGLSKGKVSASLMMACVVTFVAVWHATSRVAVAADQADQTTAVGQANAADQTDAALSPSFFTNQARMRIGSPGVLAFKLSETAKADQSWSLAVAPAGVVEVVQSPAVLAGYDVGFIQLRPLKAGTCELRLGDSVLKLEVQPAAKNSLLEETGRPRLVTPSRGAAVWGRFTVGVEIDDLDATALSANTNDHKPQASEVVLEVGQSRVKPMGPPQVVGPMRRYVFEVDADAQPAGVLAVTAVVTGEDGKPVRSEPLRVLAIKTRTAEVTTDLPAGVVIAQECEATLNTPRNTNLGMERPRVGRDPAASGSKYVSSYSQNPAWAFSLQTKTPGQFQVMIVARGDEAAGAFPSIGMAINGEDRSTTGARLVDARWRRYAVGTPFYLDAGEHVIAAKFINDFYAENLVDRNLYLDRYEIVRVDGPQADNTQQQAAGSGSKMTGSSTKNAPPAMQMMMAGGSPSTMMMNATRPQQMTMSAGGAMQSMKAMQSMQAMQPMQPGKSATSMKMMDGLNSMVGLYQDKSDATALVSFVESIHGREVRSDVTLKGQVWWPDPRNADVPRTTLLINGKPFDAQWSEDPTFKISTGYFKPGVNSVQLLTELKDGGSGISPVQALIVPAEVAQEGYKRRFMRFAVADPAWASLPNGLFSTKYPQGRRLAQFHTNSEAVLNLPADLTGEYEVVTEMSGDEFQGKPIAQVSLRVKNKTAATDNEDDQIIGQAEANRWQGERRIGKVNLPAGDKQLVVKFINDHYVEGKGDRNLALRAVLLRQAGPTRNDDYTPPAVELLYPAEGQVMFDADAVVATAWDNDDIAWVDLVIDGKPQGLYVDLSSGTGKLVFPLLLRSLSPGKHRVKLRARDRAQNMAESKEVTIEVLADSPSTLTRYQRATRLLNRFAFGPDDKELADVLTMGEKAWLAERLARPADDLSQQAVTDLARAIYPATSDYGSISQRVVKEIMASANPVRLRFVLWTENHFSTWIRKTEAARKWDEHERFTKLGPAPFGQLLLASATSPAMLIYLDQARSFAGSINENYAREIMELHTLGVHAGYTQEDVTELANVLCGWTFSEETSPTGSTFPLYPSFRFDPALSDGKARRVFGMSFPAAAPLQRYSRVRVALQMLAAHPATARFIATKLAEHYVAIPAPKALVDDLTQTYLATDGDMNEMLIAIAEHPEFWRADLPAKIARPIDYFARVYRATKADDVWQAHLFLQRSGMGMFDHITPDGYPEEDANYADTNALLQRWRLSHSQRWRLSTLVPGPWHQPSRSDPQGWRQQVVDIIAIRLTGHTLSKTSNQAALNVLEKARGSGYDRMQQIAPFIASLPEASLR